MKWPIRNSTENWNTDTKKAPNQAIVVAGGNYFDRELILNY